MGAWDIGPFDNDEAADWLSDLEESDDTSVMAAALDSVTEVGDEALEAPECSCALAAAEIIAALRGHPHPALPDGAKAWVQENREVDVSGLLAEAISAVERIRTDSELQDLWSESEKFPLWDASLEDVLQRLRVSSKK